MERMISRSSGVSLAAVVMTGVVLCLPAFAAEPPAKSTMGAKPPEGAIVLFDGKDASGWIRVRGRNRPHRWKVEDDALVCVPHRGSIRTKQVFGDCKLHLEFKVPLMPKAEKGSQARGNSGVFVQGRYEVQVLDSYDIGRPIQDNDCGGLYKLITPSSNACKPPQQWQTYDITFRAPSFDADKKMTKKGRLTVVQNGITIIDDKEIPGTTPGGVDEDPKQRGLQYDPTKPGPLMLQDHGNTVAYRNIWLVPLK